MSEKNELDIKDEDLKEDDYSDEDLANDDTDWKAEAQKLKGIAKRRATQLSKAKTKFGEFETQLGEKEKELGDLRPLKKPPQDKIENKSNEPDYAKLAWLEAKGYKHPDEQKIILDEAKRLNLPMNDIEAMPHIQGKITTGREEREAKTGMPSGTKRSGGYTQHDVEYYIQNPDKYPEDQELAEKVLEAKQKMESSKKFSDSMFTG